MQTIDILRDRFSDSLFVPTCVFRNFEECSCSCWPELNDNFLFANLLLSDSTGENISALIGQNFGKKPP